MASDVCRVLSIQSHVVHGYVGNRSVVFPLQLLGFEVDFIDSVQFSNHTWYKEFKGPILNESDLSNIYDALKANNLHHYDYIITGYIGSESFLRKVRDIVKDLKQVNPAIKYVCDPVMGDDHGTEQGVYYVPASLLPIYQEEIIPLADLLLPNQWEAEQLLSCKIKSEADVRAAIDRLHEAGPKQVVITSTIISKDKLVGFASTRGTTPECIRMTVDRLDGQFIGTGDLFSALWLAWSHQHPNDLKLVANKVQSSMKHVLVRTMDMAKKAAGGGETTWEQRELKLIQSKKDIEQPELCVLVENC